MNLGFFPSGYPDELLYSMQARFAARMRYSTASSAMTVLFGTRQRVAVIDLPSYLNVLCRRLPDKVDANTLIDEHTLFPWYAPFLPPNRREHIRDTMKGSAGGAIHTRIGAMASRISVPTHLRYCPQCVVADRAKYGETYWHRMHQLSGISVCYVHHCSLNASSIQTQRQSTYYQFFAAEDHIPSNFAAELHSAPSLQHIVFAEYAYMILNTPFKTTLDEFNSGYRFHLNRQQFMSVDGSLRMRSVHSAIKAFYGIDLLRSLGCSLDHESASWLMRLLYKPKTAHHPLYHLLLMYFLGQTPCTIHHLPQDEPPFGYGPWPCLNSVCSFYRQNVITTCHTHKSRYAAGKPIAKFQCLACGFTYQRTGPDTVPTDQLRIDKMIHYGAIWEADLKTRWNDTSFSLRAIARSLSADVGTIKRYADQLGLLHQRPTLRQSRNRQMLSEPRMDKTHEYRHLWKQLLTEHPDMSRSRLRQDAPHIYAYLYRHDRAWLFEHQPPVRKSLRQSPQINWDERDIVIAHAIEEANQHLRTSSDRPKQITIAALGRATGHLMLLQKHLHKLPKTAHMLATCVETREAWAIRRIQYEMNHASTTGMFLKRWELTRAAGVERLKNHTDVRKYLHLIGY